MEKVSKMFFLNVWEPCVFPMRGHH